MKIEKDSVVYIAFTLKGTDGEVLDQATADDPLPFIIGQDQVIPGLEKALIGKTDNDTLTLTLSPEEAFGVYQDDYVQEASKDMFEDADDLTEGMTVEVQMDTEDGDMMAMGTITKMTNDVVLVDLNHPLAGKTLHYDLEVVFVRQATPEEQDLGVINDFNGE
jgi:FKBP-type peptidyl-prolyl cis-trans isomerase SlyD